MTDGPDPERLKELDARIEALRKAGAPPPRVVKDFGSADLGWRMVIELVSGLLVGAGMGYGLDRLFGTMPVFLVGLTLLGFGAGVRVMLRTAQDMQGKNAGGQAAPGEGDEHGRRG